MCHICFHIEYCVDLSLRDKTTITVVCMRLTCTAADES